MTDSVPFPTLRDLKSALRREGFTPSKARGQNFLFEHKILQAVAKDVAPGPRDIVLEIGCGCGFLTLHLAQEVGTVLAVEIDRTLTRIAGNFLKPYPKAQVMAADLLTGEKVNPAVLKRLDELGGCDLIAGSLPYSAATAMITALSRSKLRPRKMLFLLQEEVARRLGAAPGSRDYGALSVITARAYETTLLRKVGPNAFWPRPKVESRLVCLQPKKRPCDLETFSRFVHALFSQPRKTAVNSLLHGISRRGVQAGPELRKKITELLVSLELTTSARPGSLSLNEIEAIYKNLAPIMPK